MSGTGRRKYLGLDVIRFMAAILVMIYHLSYWNWQTLADDPSSERYRLAFTSLSWLAAQGWVGVPIFFVLSGFVIAFSANDATFETFLRGRVMRLYPAAWICSSVTLIVLIYSQQADIWNRYLRSILLWPVGPWVSGVYWTLGVEITFYCVVALILLARGSKGLHLIGWTLAVASGIYLGVRVCSVLLLHGMFKELNYFESPVGSLFLLSSGGYFALGIALWARMVDPRRAGSRWSIAVAAAVSLVAVIAAARFKTEGGGHSAMLVLVAPSLWFIAVVGIVGSIRYADWLQNRFGHLSGQIRTLGLLTYPCYLLHDILGTFIMRRGASLAPTVALTIAIMIILACSYAVVKLERYPLWLLKKVWSVNTRPAMTAPSELP